MTAQDNDFGVIFDLDGVLVDTGEFHKHSWYDLAKKENLNMSDEFFYRTFGMQNYQIIPMMTDRDLSPQQVEQWSLWKEQRYRELIDGKLKPLDGVEPLIVDLKSNGFRLAVGSSAPDENVKFILKGAGLYDYFDTFVSGDDISNGKPAPDTFLKAAEKLSLPPHRCVVIEDALHGIEAAQTAGIPVIAITTTKPRSLLTHADIVVDCMTELSAQDFKKLLA